MTTQSTDAAPPLNGPVPASTEDPLRATPTSAGALGSPDRLKALLQLVGSVVAPTTLLTALLFYFGWAHAYWFFSYFGFDISLLGLTTQDYVMRSVDALFVPLTVSLGIALLLVWANAAVAARVFTGPEAEKRLQTAARIVASCGLLLFLTGMAGFLVKDLRNSYHFIYPLSLGSGTLLLSYASRLHRKHQSAGGRRDAVPLRLPPLVEAAGAFLLVAVSLFWASTNYAAAVGETRARQYAQEFTTYPAAFVYSTERLHLDAPGVVELACDEPGAGYRFRYEGLRLMLRSGGHYFLLPETWSRRDGVGIVVPENDSIRLQFMRTASGVRSPELGVSC